MAGFSPNDELVESAAAQPFSATDTLVGSAPAAAAPAAAPASLGQQLQAGAQAGALSGAMDVLGLPASVNQLGLNFASWVANKLGFENVDLQNPAWLPSSGELETLYREYTGLGDAPTDEELGFAGRAARGTTRVAPALAIPFPGSAVAAARASAPASAVARGAALDTGEAVGAGIAETAAEDVFGDSPVGQIIAAIVGGTAGRAGVDIGARAGASAAARAASRVTGRPVPGAPPEVTVRGDTIPPEQVNLGAAALQQRVLEGGDTPASVIREITEGEARREGLGITSPATTGQIADVPGLLPFEQRMRGVRGPQFERIQRDAASEVESTLRQAVPVGNPEAVRPLAEADFAQLARAEAAVEQAEAALRGTPLRSDVPVPRSTASTAIDVGFRDALERARTSRDALYNAIDPQGTRVIQLRAGALQPPPGQTVLNPGGTTSTSGGIPLVDAMSRVRNIATRIGGPEAGSWQPIIDDLDRFVEEGFIPVRELGVLNQRLANNIDRAQASLNPVIAGELQPLLIELRRSIRATYDALGGGLTPTSPEARQALNAAEQARDFYRDVFSPAFREGAGGRLRQDIRREASGRAPNAAIPSQTGGRFLTPGVPEHAEQLNRILNLASSRAAADQGVRDYLVGDLLRTAQGREQLNFTQLQNWRRRYGTLLDEFPSVRDEVDDMLAQAGRRSQDVTDLTARLQRQQQTLDADPVQRFRTSERAEEAVSQIFGSRNPVTSMRRVVDRIGNDAQALQGLQAAVRNTLRERIRGLSPTGAPDGETVRQSYAQMDRFMRRNRPVLEQIYTPEQMQYLDRAWNLSRDAARGNLRVSSGSDTQPRLLQEAANTAFETLLRIRYGLLRGGGISRIIRQVKGVVGRRLGARTDQQAIEDVIDEAMLDPDLARRLLEVEIQFPERQGAMAAPTATAVQELEQELE